MKIDRRFVAGLGKVGGDSVIVSSMIELAHNLGLMVLAEGVETEREVERLSELGCELAQGYYFTRPMSADEMTAFLQEQTARQLSDKNELLAQQLQQNAS